MVALYLGVIMCMRVLQSLYSKRAAITLPNVILQYVSYITLSKFLAAVFALIVLIAEWNFSGLNLGMILIATCSGIFLTIGSFCGIKAVLGGTIVLSSIFGTAGMIVPCILGIFVFDEPMTYIHVICILVLLFSAILLIDASKKIFSHFSTNTLVYLIGNLISNGMVMFCQKLFGEIYPDGNVSMFSMLTFLIPSIVLLIAMPFFKKEKTESPILPKKLISYAAILSFAVFIIQQLVTLLTPLLSSAVLFTFVNGGATIIAAIVGMIVYKEKITVKSAIGIVLGVMALVCIKIYE